MAKSLKHYGVLGMRWGVRRAGGGSTVKVGRGPLGAAKEVAGLTVDAIRDDVNKGKKAASSIVNSKAFKTMVYDKDNVTGLIFKKSEVEKLKKFFSRVGEGMKANFYRSQIRDSKNAISDLKEAIAETKSFGTGKTLSLKQRKQIKDWEDEIKWMEEDLTTTFTKEELDKYG